MKKRVALSTCTIFLGLFFSYAQRTVINLSGTWSIEESVKSDQMPRKYTHTVLVPGLVKNAVPAFMLADKYQSREYLLSLRQRKELTDLNHGMTDHIDTIKCGRNLQPRNYYWYRTTFNAGKPQEVALLKINKAQFGVAAWINGKKVGEYTGCFTPAVFQVTKHVLWNAPNEVVIRIGAHPGVLPPTVPAGTDCEKTMWTAGIYDEVYFIACNNPCIEYVQTFTDYLKGTVSYETKLHHYGAGKKIVTLTSSVCKWKSNEVAGRGLPQTFLMAGGETKLIRETIRIDNPLLWTPETPVLYVLNLSTEGDSLATRFGIRDFRFDTRTKKALLNGQIYYLRGTNITLHRFFEDSLCGYLPWTDSWVRKLLIDIPKEMGWNSMRFCIGPVPQRWLDIADEAGLLIQNEFFIWGYRDTWDKEILKSQLKEWIIDNCNHPSIGIWNLCNETRSDVLAYEVLPEVRKTDLSNRPWSNGYFLPYDENDPVDDHHYFFYWPLSGDARSDWKYSNYEQWTGEKSTNSPHPTAHAVILNEYGWLWLRRNGFPTLLTRQAFQTLAPNASPEQRIELAASLLATETEYFRAHRNYAGVMHFTYLTCDHENAFTCDLFKNVTTLELHEPYKRYLSEAFQPLGIYLNFTRDSLAMTPSWTFDIMMVNDKYTVESGQIELLIMTRDGKPVEKGKTSFSLSGLSAHTYRISVPLPRQADHYILQATAYPRQVRPVSSRKPLRLVNP